MQKHKKMSARILSLALSVAMVTTLLPMTVFAAEGGVPIGVSTVGTIKSFEKLGGRFIPAVGKDAPDHVYGLSVAPNTPVEDLNLPDELTAMVERTTTVSAPAVDEPVVDSGKPSEPAVDEVIPDEDEEKETTVTTTEQESIPVTWHSDKEYQPGENGTFLYTAVLPDGYILADGVNLPQIYVAVGIQARASGNSAITVDGTNGYTLDKAGLDKAISDIADGGTITLGGDITGTVGFSISGTKTITLDLDGHKIELKTDTEVIDLTGTANLTIKDSRGNGKIKNTSMTNKASVIKHSGTGVLTVEGGTIIAANEDCIYNAANGSVIIKGGVIEVTGNNNNSVIYNNSTGSITVEGGIVRVTKSNSNMNVGIRNIGAGAVTISGGIIETKGGDANVSVLNVATGVVTVSGGTLISDEKSYYKNGSADLIIDGGTIQGIVDGTPKNTGGTAVYNTTITLSGASGGAKITGITGPASYGTAGITTDSNGKIYLYLPENTVTTAVSTDGTNYTGTVTTTRAGTASATFTGAAALTTITASINGTAHGGTTLQAIVEANGGVTAVTSLKITAGKVTTADWKYLTNLSALNTFEIDAAVTDVVDIPSTLGGTFPKSITSVTVPQAIVIGSSAFSNCDKLTNVSFPKATTIGDSAFDSCRALTSINFPEVTSIKNNAFVFCVSLANATFPKVEKNGTSVFKYCSQLTSVSFPKATSIGAYMFSDCTRLATLTLGAIPPTIGNADPFKNCPDTRALGYVDANGNDLAGAALAEARAAYKAVDDGINDNLWHGWAIGESVDPAVTVGSQSGTLTYGKTDKATFALTFSNFEAALANFSLAWFSDAEGKTTARKPAITMSLSDDRKTLTFAPDKADAGVYYFKLTVGNESETADSAVIKMTVDQADYSGTASKKEVGIAINKTEEQSGTLTAAAFFTAVPADAKITAISNKSISNSILKGTPSLISSGSLAYTSNANLTQKDVSDTYDITIQSKNYKDIHAELSFKTTDKTAIDIRGLTAPTERKYDGTAIKNSEFGTPSYSPAWSGTLEYTYYEGSGTSGTILESAPKNVGSYTVVAKIPDSNTTYTGKMELNFTIAKATITIKADNKSAYVGDAKPTLTYTATGLASGDTLATVPTLTYESEPDMSKAGSVKIKASGAVVPSTDNYESAITYVDGTLTISNKSSGGGGGGSSSGGGSSTPPTTKPTEPVKGESNTTATVDKNGNATVNVTDKNITDAVQAAKDAANKKGVNAGEVTAVINVTSPANSNPNTVTVNLPKTVQQQVINNKIDNVAIVIDKPDISIGMNLATITEMNKQANADIQLSATRTDATKLSTEAKNAIGNRPAFDLKATYASGAKSITSFGSGSVSVAIPYTLQAGEVAGGLYAVYVDSNGKVNYITNSSYDADAKVLRFSTNHFSVYGISYKAPIAFTDIANHWAKTDIEFVVNRGLMSGTSNTTFAPNAAMTRGMFVTALGRLSGVNTKDYQSQVFTDVKADAYYAPYVNWAKSKSIVNGTTATTFAPDQSITRQEMAVIMSNYAKAMGYTVPETRTAVTFADNGSIGSWAAAAVKQMQMAGILNGKDGNRFDPTGTATRGEISAMLHRYVSLIIDKATTEGWTTNDSGSGMYYQSGKAVTGTQTISGVAYNFNSYGETTRKTATAGAATDAVLPASDKKYFIYTVKPGDWLSKIAISNHCTVEEIIALNDIKNKDLIVAGQKIKVPQK